MVEPKYRVLIEWNASVNLMLSNVASVAPSKTDQIYLNVSTKENNNSKAATDMNKLIQGMGVHINFSRGV